MLHRRTDGRTRKKLKALARALYTAPPSPLELAALGLTLADFDQDAIEAWPDNIPAFELFCKVSRQWRMGPSGPTGLDFAAVYPLIDRLNLPPDEWDSLLADVSVMEGEALSVMSEAAEEARKRHK